MSQVWSKLHSRGDLKQKGIDKRRCELEDDSIQHNSVKFYLDSVHGQTMVKVKEYCLSTHNIMDPVFGAFIIYLT